MMKNITIGHVEAEFLRSQMAERFEREQGSPPRFTTYLNSYGRLNEEIKKKMIGEEEFSSENLLRKLFSDSVGEATVTFRVGFLDAGYRYISDGKYNRAAYLLKDLQPVEKSISFWSRYGKLVVSVVAIVCGLVLASYSYFTKTASPFIEEFDDLDVGRLNKKGWLVMDYNDSLWRRQLLPGRLTQWTTVGDNWVHTGKPRIDNFIYRKTGCDCFEVTLKVDSFRPVARWQQYDLIFFEDPGKIDEFLRIGRCYNGDSKPGAALEMSSMVEVKNRNPFLLNEGIKTLRESDQLTAVWLRVVVKHRRYSFSIRFGHEGNYFYDIYDFHERDFFTLPKYVGIATFQAYNSDFKSANAPVIPALIDKFIIHPIPCE